MRIVDRTRLEDVLGEVIPKQSIPLFKYRIIYGQGESDFIEAEERKIAIDNYMGYFNLCKAAAFNNPSHNVRFAR